MKFLFFITFIASISPIAFYFWHFYFHLGFKISNNVNDWASLGSYFGGVIGPTLTFFTIIILIKSLETQKSFNEKSLKEIQRKELEDILKSLESHLFSLINQQRNHFENFKVSINNRTYSKGKAVDILEELICSLRNGKCSDEEIKIEIEKIDNSSDDSIFNMTRSFFLCLKIIDQKLLDNEDLKNYVEEYYETLISFTDFSLLRLIKISSQFMDFHSSKHIREHYGFQKKLSDLGFNNEKY